MRVSIIDLGTNSVRFDVHQLGPGNRVNPLHREKLMVRLGQGVFLNGKLDPEAYRRTFEAFESFAHTSKLLQSNKIIAFGTSALREASDSARLLKQIKTRTGIEVRVISGQEEAELIAKGILANESIPKGKYALIDIGGGSTEISICQGKGVLCSESFPLGTARLQQVFLKTNPPKAPARKKDLHPIEQLRRYLRSSILTKILSEDWPKPARIIGSSGTIRALSKILNPSKNGKNNGTKEFSIKDLKKLIKRMSTMTTTELLNLPGMEPKRVDMILAGAILLEECMTALKVKRAQPTEYSLRDGILEEEVQVYKQHRSSRIELHQAAFLNLGKKLSAYEPHFKQVQALAEKLFDGLKRVHKLKPHWKSYLSAAAILHDVGESIAPTNHSEHAYYIVKNADIPSLARWESEFIAQLCHYHQGGKIDFKFEEKKKQEVFLKLLALLRIADAMDRSHKNQLQIKRISIRKKEIRLKLAGTSKSGIHLELLRINQKKGLFEDVFKRKLVIQSA